MENLPTKTAQEIAGKKYGDKIAFPPWLTAGAHTLILGSMPGERSLQAGSYYANPNNAFWKIIFQLANARFSEKEAARRAAMAAIGISLWDVIASCRRRGSLDKDIEPTSVVANDFADLLNKQRQIKRICFNGQSSANLFKRFVARQQALPQTISLLTLSSTSPANARINFAQKLANWQALLTPPAG